MPYTLPALACRDEVVSTITTAQKVYEALEIASQDAKGLSAKQRATIKEAKLLWLKVLSQVHFD